MQLINKQDSLTTYGKMIYSKIGVALEKIYTDSNVPLSEIAYVTSVVILDVIVKLKRDRANREHIQTKHIAATAKLDGLPFWRYIRKHCGSRTLTIVEWVKACRNVTGWPLVKCLKMFKFDTLRSFETVTGGYVLRRKHV